MKKYFLIMTAVLGASLLGGCGSAGGGSAEATTQADGIKNFKFAEGIDAKEYVELGQYQGLKITKTKVEEVTDQDVEDYINEIAQDYVEYREIDRKEVQDGDFLKVDFELSIDGEKVEDYSGEDMDMEVGEGYLDMSEGFSIDSHLVGASVGDTVKVDVEFPDDYEDETYAGKKGQMSVTIHSIEEEYQPEVDDSWAQENMGFDTLEEFKQQTKQDLQTEAEDSAEAEDQQALWEQIEKNAKQIKDFPEDVIKEGVEKEQETVDEYAGYMGLEPDEFIKENYGDVTLEEYVKDNLFAQCIKDLIVEEQGITVSQEEYEEELSTYVDGESFTSEEEVLEYMGGEEYVIEWLLYDKLDEFVASANTFH